MTRRRPRRQGGAAPAGAGPRDVAARVLARVEKDSAFAAATLDAELARHVQLEPRDRALVTELVYGTLRVVPWLSSEIGPRLEVPP